MTRLSLALFALLAPACSKDDDPDGGSSSGSSTEPTTGGSSTGEPIGWDHCFVDLQCGNDAAASCVHPDGCDMPGKCAFEEPQGECPDDPAPLIPLPSGAPCESNAVCSEFGKECFFWDGKCGMGFKGVCVTVRECGDLVPAEITSRCPDKPGDGGCDSPMY